MVDNFKTFIFIETSNMQNVKISFCVHLLSDQLLIIALFQINLKITSEMAFVVCEVSSGHTGDVPT